MSAVSSIASNLVSQYVSSTSAKTAGSNFADILEQSAKAQKAAASATNQGTGESGSGIATEFSSMVGGNGSSSAFSAMLLGAGSNTASEMNNQLSGLNII
jgi:predicted transcriptional regulator